jgi:hypothetical protein
MRSIAAIAKAAAATTAGMVQSRSEEPAFNELLFKATHNSYAGRTVGTMQRQRDDGVWFVELDIFAENVASFSDYRIGHDGPGKGVALGDGNPTEVTLSAWLKCLNDWSSSNPEHAAITLLIDIKAAKVSDVADCAAATSGLASKESYTDGDLAYLNDELRRAFGAKLYRASEFPGTWPPDHDLRGRMLVVLSGDVCTRRAYRWSNGDNPAVAMNSKRQVIEVHDSGMGQLWYWTGQYQEDGSVAWYRRGRYDTGKHPAVAVNDDGWVVAVHEAPGATPDSAPLCYILGRLDSDHEIQWANSFSGTRYGDGVKPTVRFPDPKSLELDEVHQSKSRDQNWQSKALIATDSNTLQWDSSHLPGSKSKGGIAAISSDLWIEVFASDEPSTIGRTLWYRTPKVEKRRIRHEQIAFIEYQKGEDSSLLEDGAVFCAAPSSPQNIPWAVVHRMRTRLVRFWSLNTIYPELGSLTVPPVNFPATDNPFSEAYSDYCERIHVVK